MSARRLNLALLALLLLPLAVFFRPLFLGDAFLPADQLRHVAPFQSATPTNRTPWNVLRFDGITQFYPWRLETARAWRSGRLPLYNEHAFAADGGTPLWANSQSAPLYPPNAVFTLLGPERLWYGFGFLAALHLLIAATGTFRFARGVGLSQTASLLAAATFALSGPVTTWLSLPTFLSVVAWLPWLLHATRRAVESPDRASGRRAIPVCAALIGLILLAGHLQMALYCLLAAGIWAIFLLAPALKTRQIAPAKSLGALALVVMIGVGLALPQLLPSVALSRVSHRAGATASLENYSGYVGTALPARNLATFALPDFFGHPNKNDGAYWNTNNYGEWALYVGIVPILLALISLALPWKRVPEPGFRARPFLATLAALALLLAFGTPLNFLPYFLIPGFSQTGNPGRVLVIAAFALALLAGIGLDGLARSARETPKLAPRAVGIAVASLALVTALGVSQAAAFARSRFDAPFSQLVGLAFDSLLVAGGIFLVSVALLIALTRKPDPLAPRLILALAALDLFFWGYGYNPTSPAASVYPVTPGILWLQQNARDALIAPINDRWSLGSESPKDAVLPPNALTVYGLHDLAGYDSLFEKSSKDRIEAATGADPCPPENGNMVFIKTVDAAVALGARYIVVAPTRTIETAALTLVHEGDDLRIYENPDGKNAPPPRRDLPAPVRNGLILGAIALAAWLALTVSTRKHNLPKSEKTSRSDDILPDIRR